MTEAASLKFTGFSKDPLSLLLAPSFSVTWFLEEKSCAWAKAQFDAPVTGEACGSWRREKQGPWVPLRKSLLWASGAICVHVGAKRVLQAICRTIMVKHNFLHCYSAIMPQPSFWWGCHPEIKRKKWMADPANLNGNSIPRSRLHDSIVSITLISLYHSSQKNKWIIVVGKIITY